LDEIIDLSKKAKIYLVDKKRVVIIEDGHEIRYIKFV